LSPQGADARSRLCLDWCDTMKNPAAGRSRFPSLPCGGRACAAGSAAMIFRCARLVRARWGMRGAVGQWFSGRAWCCMPQAAVTPLASPPPGFLREGLGVGTITPKRTAKVPRQWWRTSYNVLFMSRLCRPGRAREDIKHAYRMTASPSLRSGRVRVGRPAVVRLCSRPLPSPADHDAASRRYEDRLRYDPLSPSGG
jgi:hypothetical protein